MLKKLLLAGSITALSAASAHAQVLSITTSTPITPALELDLTGTPSFTTSSSIVLDAGGAYPANSPMLISLTLPTGVVFSSAATPGDLTGLDQGALDVTVSTGGAAGDSTVTYLVTSNAVGEEQIQYMGGLTVEACPASGAGVTMTANLTGGTPISGGTATSTSVVNECESALNGTAGPDGTDSIILLPGYTSLNDNVVGEVNYYIDTAVSVDGLGNNLVSTDIDEISFDVEFGTGVGIDDAVLLGQTATLDSAGVASFSFTAAADIATLTDNSPDSITVVLTGGSPAVEVESQSVTITNALVQFNDSTADLIDDEPGAEGSADDLSRQGQVFGVFDWNDGRAGRTTSVYRATGFQPGQTFDYEVEMTNSIFAAPNNVFRGTGTADSVGEFVMTSVGFGGIVPTFGRGDAEITFEVTETIDVDRLMVRNGISTEFGDGANSSSFFGPNQPNNDDDNGSE